MDYLIVLFKNKKRKKIIKKFKLLENAKSFYKKKLEESNKIVFEKKFENAEICEYELALISPKDSNFESLYIKDHLGRQIKVDIDGDLKILQIEPYKISEKLYDVSEESKISFGQFEKNYLNKKTIKMLSKLNNKIVLQDEDKINLFSLKNEIESERFLNCLRDYLIETKNFNYIIVSETSKPQKKYLYKILDESGISKKILYRNSTTFKPRK
jgi:hypothetical protein